ncbi:Inner membrane ABC transporter permease protein YdcV [compost metagenome]
MITSILVRLVAWSVLGYMLLPLVVILGVSVTATSFLAFPPQGWTLDWYSKMLSDPSYVASFATSTILALAATFVAVLLSVPAALAMARYEFRGKATILAALTSPLVFPHIVLGAALLQFGGYLGLTRSFLALLIGHTIIISPFVLRSVLSMLTPDQRALEEASSDLGGSPWTTFFLVTLPQIRPGLVTGSIFAFISSWINVELSIFNTTPDLNTIPVKLFNYVQYTVDPTIAAASGATILVVVVAVIILDLCIGLDLLSERK